MPIRPPSTAAVDGLAAAAGAAPALGQHIDSILAELGYDPADIARLSVDSAA